MIIDLRLVLDKNFLLQGESTVAATDKLKDLLSRFQDEIVNRGVQARENQPKLEIPQPKVHWHVHKGWWESASSIFSIISI